MKRFIPVLLLIFVLIGCSNQYEKEPLKKVTFHNIHTPTMSSTLPLNGKRIVIDPGHGGIDAGAVANNLYEKDVNLTISKYTKKYLETLGAKVYLTRDSDKALTYEYRVKTSIYYNADIFISIHNNSDVPSSNGTEVYYNEFPYMGENNPFPSESKQLAKAIHDSLTMLGNLKQMGVKENNYFVLRKNSIPSVLVEVAFLTNIDNANRLKNPDDLQAFASAIAIGIQNYFLPKESEVFLIQ
ncbi:N-acetylmuramoyl-L-alanine amidase family protein [Bacillus kwashiorkori]|uniref:N-acetylmuramoyl-L-alanine amidase family protein n=1 Tax=Bacillus kwashiorkori TaxID=1522318 RepID=UPI00078180BB|nr:N-acetylmuramoyl-L-alanine amidase [Bacillus kwashiorkori]